MSRLPKGVENSLKQLFMRPEVLFIFRKPLPSGNYSVENLFSEILRQMSLKINCKKLTPIVHSQGVLRRLFICIDVFFRRGKINIITGDISFAALFLPKKTTVLVILDCGFLYDTRGFRRWLEALVWFRVPFYRASNVVVISQATKNDLIKITKGDPNKIKVIPCFVNPLFKRVDKDFCENRPVLLQVGQASNKNLTRIIHAIKGLNLYLSIIGNIDEKNSSLLEKYNIEYSMSVNLTDEEVLTKYIECDMLIFPSTYEGFGLPIAEAQSVGRPVITSVTTSMPWVAGTGACFVDPYSVESIRQGILKVIDDKHYRESLVENGFGNVKRFDSTHVASMYTDLVMSIRERIT